MTPRRSAPETWSDRAGARRPRSILANGQRVVAAPDKCGRVVSARTWCRDESRQGTQSACATWDTLDRLRKRFTTWLVAALLLIGAGFSAPTASIAMPRAASSIVWIYKSVASKREVPKIREAVGPARSRAT